MSKIQMSVRATLLAVAFTLPVVTYASADTPPKQINIAAGDLSQALLELSRQYRVDLVYRPEQVYGLRTPGAHGELTTEQAATQLLKGTNLRLSVDESGAIFIALPASAAPNKASQASKNAPEPPKSFWSRFRLAQADTPSTSQADTNNPSPSKGEGQGDDERRGQSPKVNELEEVVVTVTGSHIRGAQNTASPVYSFNRESFAQQGAGSVQQVLSTLPQNFTGGPSEQSGILASTRNNTNGNLGYGAGVNLRGLGSEATLVLINGRRLAPSGFGNYTDISTIPLSAIERIEVMPDGASAIYGSDAVGGVVNVILRENFEGAESQARYAAVTDGGLRQFTISQIAGTQWSSGSVMANIDYGEYDPLLASERPFATGLQNGVTYLSPSGKRWGALVRAEQDLSSTVRLAALVQFNDRETDTRTYQQTQGRQHSSEGNAEQLGGTLALDWRVGETWTLTLAQSEQGSEVLRVNNLGASATIAASRTEVFADNDVSTTELESEGALFALPGGQARLALGAERRDESLKVRRVNTGNPFSPLERDVTAGYAELFLPVFGDNNGAPFARRLNFTLAGRYEDYSDVGSADTYKFGTLWSPVDGVNIRGTYGTSFRAPYLYQYDRSMSQAVVQSTTVVNPAVIVAYVLNLPAPDLGPENATTWNAGFDIDQDVLGVKLSATYFSIDYEDRIRAASTPFGNFFTNPLLVGLVSSPPDPEVMAAVASAATIANVSGQPLSAVQVAIDARIRNQGLTELSGIDVTLDRSFDTGVGAFGVGANASYLLNLEVSPVKAAPLADILSTIYNPVDLKGRAYLTWSQRGWSASAYVNYLDDYIDNQVIATPVKVSSWTTLDLGLGYRFENGAHWSSGLSVRLNAQNVLDKDPPSILDRGSAYGNPGYDTENGSPIGRLVSLMVSKTW